MAAPGSPHEEPARFEADDDLVDLRDDVLNAEERINQERWRGEPEQAPKT